MTKSVQKIALSPSRDIPFDKLRLSQSNVRHIKAGVSIEELAEDIARRTLLQSLTVRAIIDESGAETGDYEIPAGGRRFRALELLVKQKRLAKTTPIPCVVREGGLAEEDSLAENIQRVALHPLDQFRAFLAMRERGMGEEAIAAAFFVSVAVVKQRLRLASVSPALLDLYAEDAMTLEQLMAFTVNPGHARQEQVWDAVQRGYDKGAHAIRRMLTEATVRASDKRVRFVGLDAYEEAGGATLRDLLQSDDGGWLTDAGLLDMLVAEKLRDEADAVRAEGWRWVEAAPDFPYGHTWGLRGIVGGRVELTEAEQAARDALVVEQEQIESEYHDAELPDEIDARLGQIERALAGYDDRPTSYRPEDLAIAGAFVGIDGSGRVKIERGYVRPEDELPTVVEPTDEDMASDADRFAVALLANDNAASASITGEASQPGAEPEEDEGMKPLSDRLITELTAHRTLALREAVGCDPEVAFVAALHALCLKLFYYYGLDSCLDLDVKSVAFAVQAPGMADSPLAQTLTARHGAFKDALPSEPGDLWDALVGFEDATRRALFAHCVGLSVNAVYEAWSKRPRALAHADMLAQAVGLDLAQSWTPTVANFLGRVTKAQIRSAVREARSERAADRIADLRKGEMADAAEALLAGTGWLPAPLRTPGQAFVAQSEEADVTDADYESVIVETAANDGASAIDPSAPEEESEDVPLPAYANAAE